MVNHPLSELKQHLELWSEKGAGDTNGRYLILLPDWISINNVEDLAAGWGRTYALLNGDLLTLDSFATQVLCQTKGFDTMQISDETRRLIACLALEEMAKDRSEIASRIWALVSTSANPQNEPIVKGILIEMDEYSTCIGAGPNSKKNHSELVKIAKEEEDAFVRNTSLEAMEFFSSLLDKMHEISKQAAIDGAMTRAELVSNASQVLKNAKTEGNPLAVSWDEILVLGFSAFDATVLDLLQQISTMRASMRICVGESGASRLKARLENETHTNISCTIKAECRELSKAQVIEAPDMRREIEAVFSRICELGDQSIPPDDIVLAARDIGKYLPYIEQASREFGVPAFIQTRRPLALTVGFRLVMSVLDLLVAVERNEAILPRMLTDPYRLGFIAKFGNERVLTDRQFLFLENRTVWLSESRPLSWTEWKGRIKTSGNSSLSELMDWVDGNIKEVGTQPIDKLLIRFVKACSDWRSELRLSTGFSPDRFRICDLHITARVGRLHSLIDRLESETEENRALRGGKKLNWSDVRGGFLSLAGKETYGLVNRDGGAVRCVDAGISQFIESKARFVLGLSADSFPRVFPRPLLIPTDFRKTVNSRCNRLYYGDDETDFENEQDTFNSAIGPTNSGEILFTFPFLDERGHKKPCSIFISQISGKKIIGARTQVSEDSIHSSPAASWKNNLSQIRGSKDLVKAFESECNPEFREVCQKELMPRIDVLERRIIKGESAEPIERKIEPYLEEFLKDLDNELVPSHDIDLYSFCPTAFYFYRYLFALGPFNRDKKGKGSRFFVPEYKNDFSLGPIPTPLRRSTISTTAQGALEKAMSNYHTIGALRENEVEIKESLRTSKGLDFLSKKTLVATIDLLLRDDDVSTLQVKPAGPNSTATHWRPILVISGNRKRHLARAAPPLLGSADGGEQRSMASCLSSIHKKLISPIKGAYYDELGDDQIEKAISLIKSSKFTKQKSEDNCRECVYATLCCEWGFL